MSRAGWRGLVVGLLAITVTVSAFYWVLTFNPRQVTTTVTVTGSTPRWRRARKGPGRLLLVVEEVR